tara:strand:+ start:1043 stop:2389 length:1347 start_codon:yes stop_codon:yes gene_type:complete
MSGIIAADQIEIKEIAIRSEKFQTGKKLYVAGEDQTPVAVALDIFENIYYPYLTGYLYMSDDNDVVRTIQARGTERLDVVLRSPGATTFIEKTFIISSMPKSVKVNDTTSHLLLELTEDHGYFNEIQKINKAYKGTGPEIIKKIVEDNTTKKLKLGYYQDVDQPEMRYVVPWQSSYQAVNTVMRNITTPSYLPYFFFSTLSSNNLILADLETIMRRPAFNKDIRPYTFSRAGLNKNASLEEIAFNIGSIQTDHTNDTLTMAKKGALGSYVETLDSLTGQALPSRIDMREEFKRVINNNPEVFQGLDIPIDRFFRVDDKPIDLITDYNSKIFSSIACSPYKDFNGLASDNLSILKILIKNNFIRHMGNNSFNIFVPGLAFGIDKLDRSVGSQINIRILKDGAGDGPNPYDERRSGDYIMMSKRHIFDIVDNTHNVVMRVGRIAEPKRLN